LSVAGVVREVPSIDDLRKQLTALSDQRSELSGSGLSKATAHIRDRPVAVVLAALGIGLIGGYLLKR
jgi:ElaB/YqjD/DUF883 family membrane-anchored ribosome-binding protein